jgi:hypothetical protein
MDQAQPKTQLAALRSAKIRSDAIRVKVERVLELIKREMAENNGIYPENEGAISLNEVARRAGIGMTTLFAPKQSDLRKQVKEWLDSLKKTEVVGRETTRRKLTERVADWQQAYNDIREQFILVELELQDARVQLEAMQQKYDALLVELRSRPSNVSALPLKPKNAPEEDR